MNEPLEAEVTVTLCLDDSTGISLSKTDRPVEVLRRAAAVLERYAASIERDHEPIICETCGTAPTGVHADPAGEWRFEPCGHGVPAASSLQPGRSVDQYPHSRQDERMDDDEESDSERGKEHPGLRHPKGEGWCPKCGRRLRDRDEHGTYLCECGMAVTYGEGRPNEDDHS